MFGRDRKLTPEQRKQLDSEFLEVLRAYQDLTREVPLEKKPRKACPMCECDISMGVPVSWTLALHGEKADFSVNCCAVDAYLCNLFPTLRTQLSDSQPVQELLRQYLMKRAWPYGPQSNPWDDGGNL